MQGCGVASLVVVVLVASSLPYQCEAQGWEQLVPLVVNKVSTLWEQDQLEVLGHVCNYSVTPKIRRWQLYFRGRMWCPGWVPFRGEALTRSRSGVVGKTVRDFINKAHNAGKITEQDARLWLQQ